MIKNFLGGIAIGIANIIPGVSGGTIMVLIGLFDKMMDAISNVFKIKISWKERLENIYFLLQVAIGVAIGLVGFAKILEFLFVHFEMQTLFWFVGLILFSIPLLKKQELKNEKISWIYFVIGMLIIGLIAYFAPSEEGNIVALDTLLTKNLTPIYLITLVIVGAISGATMIFPGVSGSMVLLVIGQYHLFKGYVANVTTFDIKILIPLCFIALGVGIGVIASAKITSYLLKHYKKQTLSLIIGLILMSAITIIPTSGYTVSNTLSSILLFLFGGAIVILFEKMKKTNK